MSAVEPIIVEPEHTTENQTNEDEINESKRTKRIRKRKRKRANGIDIEIQEDSRKEKEKDLIRQSKKSLREQSLTNNDIGSSANSHIRSVQIYC